MNNMVSQHWESHISRSGRVRRPSRFAAVIGRLASATALACLLGVSAADAGEINYPSFQWTEPTYGAFMKELKADFEKNNPGIKVKDTFIPYSSFADQMFVDISSGNAPDVLTAFDPDFKRYIDADLLEPLNPYLDAAGLKLEDFIAPEQLAVSNGKIYGIPFASNPRALFVNTQMLKSAGLELPKNFEDFQKIVKALRDPKQQTFGLALSAYSGSASQQFLEYAPIVASFGARFFTDGKPSADTPEMLKALTFYKSVVDQNLVPKGAKFEVFRPMFVNGKIAMYAAGPFMAAVTQAGNLETYKNITTVPLMLGNGKPITVTSFLAIPKSSQNKEETAKFLMTLLQEKWQGRLVELASVIPGRKNMIPAAYLKSNPWFETFNTLASEAVSYAPAGVEQYGSDIIAIIGKRIEAMLFGGVSAQDTTKLIQSDLVAFMATKR
ncbi:ABC transporter substrate-binding protein [Chelatococcus asaccharovorans]|nr:sugar ABC transporter substrate-binding protein [Chelatococcus asaccharovorans]MBS7704500.1 sugar ABC transporter substrate-binding protein [Chelatococcus asaccharovorans]